MLTNLDRPWNVVGYAAGVSIGVYLGCLADGWVAPQPLEYRVVVPGDGAGLAAELRARRWPVTVQAAAAVRGPSAALFVAVDAARAGEVERDLDELAPGEFRTSTRLRSAGSAPLPPAYLTVGGSRTIRRSRSAQRALVRR